ncbi:MAG: ABC transporter permease [Ruminococcaceae bacterium]|nr:ABC transporter permease [Oscillospiraceae bacterium]
MTVIQKVTLATLKKNRRRTVITILGTAVAVAMVTALAVLAASFHDMFYRAIVRETGGWQIRINGIDKDAMPTVEAYDNLKFADYSLSEGFAKLPGREGYTRSALAMLSYTQSSFERLPVTVSEGRLPEKPGEIILSNDFRETGGMNWAMGDTVTLDTGHYTYEYEEAGETHRQTVRESMSSTDGLTWVDEGERSFTVVGYGNLGRLEQGWQGDFTALGVFDPAATVAGWDFMRAYLEVQRVSEQVFDDGTRLATDINATYQTLYPEGETPETGLSFNHELLGLQGVMASNVAFFSLAVFMAILLLIVVIGSISLISNAFSISLAERVRALGMLAGVGATRRQKRSSVFFEALIIGVFAIPAGILGGIAGIGITLAALGGAMGDFFYSDVDMQMLVPLWVILFTVVFSALILLISAWLPARRASKVAPIEAMRAGGEQGKIKRVRVSRLTRRIFGFEAELGIKNSKRSRRRYFAILSSLIISVVLFLTVSTAMDFIRSSTSLVYGDELVYNVQLQLNHNRSTEAGLPETAPLAAELRALPHAGEMDGFVQFWGTAQLPPSDITAEGLRELTLDSNGNYHLDVTLWALDDESFARYLQKAGLGAAVMESDRIPAILLSPVNTATRDNGRAMISATTMGPGYNLAMPLSGWANAESGLPYEIPLEVAAVSNVFPEVVNNRFSNARALPMVLRESDVRQYAAAQGDALEMQYVTPYQLWAKSPDPAKLYDEADTFETGGDFIINAYNKAADAERDRMGLVIVEVFTYGFIVLITLVCAANIFNTVSTGIALRTREFAMLRSAGLTSKGFNKMLDCETLFYGLKALLWGIPLSILLSFLLYGSVSTGFSFGFSLQLVAYLIAVAGVFLLVGLSMLYARSKVKNLNIAETLKNENW